MIFINERLTTVDYLTALYHTLKKMRGRDFREDCYKWRLGVSIFHDIGLNEFNIFREQNKPKLLFGIEVEIDYSNPYNVQIFEDITNKIYIDKGADNDISTKES